MSVKLRSCRDSDKISTSELPSAGKSGMGKIWGRFVACVEKFFSNTFRKDLTTSYVEGRNLDNRGFELEEIEEPPGGAQRSTDLNGLRENIDEAKTFFMNCMRGGSLVEAAVYVAVLDSLAKLSEKNFRVTPLLTLSSLLRTFEMVIFPLKMRRRRLKWLGIGLKILPP